MCDARGNYVGCYHQHTQSRNRTRPLGCIATPELMKARKHIHAILDPIWQTRGMARGAVYQAVAKELGIREYHTAEIRTIEEAREVYRVVRRLALTSANRRHSKPAGDPK
jgi:hypothetical protein